MRTQVLVFFVGLKLVGTNLDGGGVVGVDAVGRGEEVPGRREHDLGLGRQRRRNLSHPGLDFLKKKITEVAVFKSYKPIYRL